MWLLPPQPLAHSSLAHSQAIAPPQACVLVVTCVLSRVALRSMGGGSRGPRSFPRSPRLCPGLTCRAHVAHDTLSCGSCGPCMQPPCPQGGWEVSWGDSRYPHLSSAHPLACVFLLVPPTPSHFQGRCHYPEGSPVGMGGSEAPTPCLPPPPAGFCCLRGGWGAVCCTTRERGSPLSPTPVCPGCLCVCHSLEFGTPEPVSPLPSLP